MASNDQKMNFSSNTEVDPQNRSDDETKGEEQPVNTKDAPLVEASTETTRENEPSNVKKGDSKSEVFQVYSVGGQRLGHGERSIDLSCNELFMRF